MVLIPTLCLIGSSVALGSAGEIRTPGLLQSTGTSGPSARRDPNFFVSLLQEKESRTAEQKKIDSRLLYAIYQMRGTAKAKGIPEEEIQLKKDSKGRVLVDVRAKVTDRLVQSIQRWGGNIIARSDRYNSIVAYVSLAKLESIARLSSVTFIMPAADAKTN